MDAPRDVDAVARRLDDGVLLGMQAAADLVALAAGHAELLTQAAGLGAMAHAGGHAVVAGGQYAAVLHDDGPYGATHARGARGDLVRQRHEVLVPAGAMVEWFHRCSSPQACGFSVTWCRKSCRRRRRGRGLCRHVRSGIRRWRRCRSARPGRRTARPRCRRAPPRARRA